MPSVEVEETSALERALGTAAAFDDDPIATLAGCWRTYGLFDGCDGDHEWAFAPPGRFAALQDAAKREKRRHGVLICVRCCAERSVTAADLEAFRLGTWPDILYVEDVEVRPMYKSYKEHQGKRHEETLAYDLKAFGGVGGPVIISEGLAPGSGEFTVFVRKPNGTGLRHVRGSPQGSLESCRAFVAKKVAEGRWAAWSPEQQRAAGYDGQNPRFDRPSRGCPATRADIDVG